MGVSAEPIDGITRGLVGGTVDIATPAADRVDPAFSHVDSVTDEFRLLARSNIRTAGRQLVQAGDTNRSNRSCGHGRD